MKPRAATIIAASCVAWAIPDVALSPDPRFRSGLTATVLPDSAANELTTRRLFYRVVVLGITGPIDTTDIVPVEIPARTPAVPKP